MGQVRHGSATTTLRYGLNHKTVAKWRKRAFVNDAPMGPKTPHSTVLSCKEEAIIVAFRKHTLLPLDDCLYALQATIPHLTRSSLHRCLKRHAITVCRRSPVTRPRKKPFKRYPIGYFYRHCRGSQLRRASSTSSWPLIGRRSWSSLNCTRPPTSSQRSASCKR